MDRRQGQGMWRGRLLSDHSKEELVAIIERMAETMDEVEEGVWGIDVMTSLNDPGVAGPALTALLATYRECGAPEVVVEAAPWQGGLRITVRPRPEAA